MSEKQEIATTTQTTNNNSTSPSSAWALPTAADCKSFVSDRVATIFWRFKQGVFGALATKKYNPVEVTLKYKPTAEEAIKIKSTFKAAGYDLKITYNEHDKDLDYLTKISIFF